MPSAGAGAAAQVPTQRLPLGMTILIFLKFSPGSRRGNRLDHKAAEMDCDRRVSFGRKCKDQSKQITSGFPAISNIRGTAEKCREATWLRQRWKPTPVFGLSVSSRLSDILPESRRSA